MFEGTPPGFSFLLLFFPFFVRALILSPLSRVMGNVYVFSRIKDISSGAFWLCFRELDSLCAFPPPFQIETRTKIVGNNTRVGRRLRGSSAGLQAGRFGESEAIGYKAALGKGLHYRAPDGFPFGRLALASLCEKFRSSNVGPCLVPQIACCG